MWVICKSHVNRFEHGKWTTTGFGVIKLILSPAIDRFLIGKIHDLLQPEKKLQIKVLPSLSRWSERKFSVH